MCSSLESQNKTVRESRILYWDLEDKGLNVGKISAWLFCYYKRGHFVLISYFLIINNLTKTQTVEPCIEVDFVHGTPCPPSTMCSNHVLLNWLTQCHKSTLALWYYYFSMQNWRHIVDFKDRGKLRLLITSLSHVCVFRTACSRISLLNFFNVNVNIINILRPKDLSWLIMLFPLFKITIFKRRLNNLDVYV